ncbi:unnamed protein product [Moneuplotes crassus]|uniref:Uncharacterized protein n=1 Tax=Euplotes crassus TaxID=5936 RepID=A0AAD1U062_EUPCR|nr:unnamed protein product [Moneuplotes crassus]
MFRSPTTRINLHRNSSSSLVSATNAISQDAQGKTKKQKDCPKIVSLCIPKKRQRNRLVSKKNLFKEIVALQTKSKPKSPEESPSQLRKRLGMMGDMRSFNLIPSDLIKHKLNYYYTPYNKKKLKTYFMTFGENAPNHIASPLEGLDAEQNLPCWKPIAEFILQAEHKQFKKIIGKFRKREIHEMKNNIKRSQQVFKKIVMKNRRFARLFQKVVKHTYSQIGITKGKEISDEMRHKISEILKNSLNMKIQEIKRRIRNHKRLTSFRKRTRRENSLNEDSKSATYEDLDDTKQLGVLEPLFEQNEFDNITNMKEYNNFVEEEKDNKYGFKISENSSSSSYTSSSSPSSQEKSDIHFSNKDLLSKLTRRRKHTIPRKSKFLKQQSTFRSGLRKICKAPSFMHSRNTSDSKDFVEYDSSSNILQKCNKNIISSKKVPRVSNQKWKSFLMPPNEYETHQAMLQIVSRRKSSFNTEKQDKNATELQNNISKYNISNYYLKGAKDILTQRVFSEPRLSKISGIDQTIEKSLGDSTMLANNSKADSYNTQSILPKISLMVNKSHSVSRLKWNRKISKIVSKRVKNKTKLTGENIMHNEKSVTRRLCRPRRSVKTKLECLYQLNSPKISHCLGR